MSITKDPYWIFSWILPFIFALFAALLCYTYWGWAESHFTVFFGIFTMVSKFFDYLILKNRNLSQETDKLNIHRNYALRDIEKVEHHIQKNSTPTSMKESLKDLENKLLHMFDCCRDKTQDKEKLKDLRGNIGNIRTQLLLPNRDKVAIYKEIATEIETLRPYLEEINK